MAILPAADKGRGTGEGTGQPPVHIRASQLAFWLFVLIGVLVLAAPAIQQRIWPPPPKPPVPLRVLHHFAGPPDGSRPYGRLVMDASGALYGTTGWGGAHNAGTVFKLTQRPTEGFGWSERVLYSFTGGSEGGVPFSGLAIDKNGALYGTTARGGPARAGTVFQLVPPSSSGGTWSQKVLHAFAPPFPPKSEFYFGPEEGSESLVVDTAGALYGTSAHDGANSLGRVFKLTPPAAAGGVWTESTLYDFKGGDGGATPKTGLLVDRSGALYGTAKGGAYGGGIVYKLDPPAPAGGEWSASVLYAFTRANDGCYPNGGLVMDAAGALYGTLRSCGPYWTGIVFKLAPPSVRGGAWTETVLRFRGGAEVGLVYSGLILGAGGSLYGTTIGGGAYGDGFIFQLAPPSPDSRLWRKRLLYSFKRGKDGDVPFGGLISDASGALYGAAAVGGSRDLGTIFKLLPRQGESE